MIEIPTIPELKNFQIISQVTATESERLASCPLRFIFDRDFSLRKLRPFTAAPMLGTAAHAALASLIRTQSKGILSGKEQSTREIARATFDEYISRECLRRDNRIAERGILPGENTEDPFSLPFYAMTRARFIRFSAHRFGELWIWMKIHEPDQSIDHSPKVKPSAASAVVPELRLSSDDGIVIGVADSVDHCNGKTVIEEFKTGELTEENIQRWRKQLLIYGYLYNEQFNVIPDQVRINSLSGGIREFLYDELEARKYYFKVREDLLSLTKRIDSGEKASELGKPSPKECKYCPHRAWCESYWRAGMPGSDGMDIEGTVSDLNGWIADIRFGIDSHIRVDFQGVRVRPSNGMRIRILGTFSSSERLLRTRSTSSVWKIPS